MKKPTAKKVSALARLSEQLEIANGKISALTLECVKLRKLAGLDGEELRRWAWEKDYVALLDQLLADQYETLRNTTAKYKEEVKGRQHVGLEAALEEYERLHPLAIVSPTRTRR